MPPNTKVCINGFVLSTLMFDCTNDSTDQEGFLYGSITRNVRDEISDLSLTGTQEDILISICSSMPFGKILSFYDDKGRIKRNEIEFNIQERKKNIIGWYRYRRYSPLYPSSRETVVHRNLKHFFGDNKMGSQYFIFAVFSSSNLPNFATHSFDYAFFTQRQNGTFRSLSTTILNLGDTRNSYRAGSMALPFLDSPSFNSVLTDTWNVENFYAIEDQIQSFHQNLRGKLESLQEELAASDAVNACLEDDIRRVSNEMQNLLATQEQLSSASQSTGTSHSTVASQSTATCSESSASDGKCNESTNLKRAAVDQDVPNTSSKRVCLDKYFESEDQNVVVSQSVSENTSTPKVSPSSHIEEPSHSQLMIVDPDNGEASSVSQSDVESNVQSPNTSILIKDVNRVPSPSSTIEVVTETGSQNYTDAENSALADFSVICLASLIIIGLHTGTGCIFSASVTSDLKSCSSPESSVRDSSQVSSPRDLNISNLDSDTNVITTDIELQSKTVSSAVVDSTDSVASTSTNLLSSTSSVVTASSSLSSEDSSRKKTSPIIIYAAKEIHELAKDSTPSTSTEKSQEAKDGGIKGENGAADNLRQKEL